MESRGQTLVKCALQEANNHARKKESQGENKEETDEPASKHEIKKINSNKNTLTEDILDGKKLNLIINL